MYAQGRQTYPNINEEEWFTIDPVAVPITDNQTFIDEGFVYNYCFTGEDNDLLNWACVIDRNMKSRKRND